MKREFIINLILLVSINLLIKPLYLFGVDAHIQNLVGPDTYGTYFALFNLVFLFQFIIEPGIQTYNSRNIAINPEKLGFHLPRILGLKVVLFLIFAVACVIAFFWNGYETDLLKLYGVLIVNLFLSTSYIYLRSNVAAIGKYRVDSFLSALDKVLMLVILGVVSWTPRFMDNFDIIWLAYGQFAAFALSCIVALILLRGHLGFMHVVFSLDYAKKLIRFSYPYMLILLSMSAYNRLDGVMLERMLNDGGTEAGIYAAGYRFVDALNMIGYLFAALLLPMYSSNIKNPGVTAELLGEGLKWMAVFVVVAGLSLIYYGGDILPLIYTDAGPYYAQVLSLLVVSFAGMCIAYLYGPLLVAHEKLLSLNILFFSLLLLNVVLNYILIPQYQAAGAAVSTLITQVLAMLGQIILVYRLINVDFFAKKYVTVILFGVLCAIIYYVSINYLTVTWYYQLSLSIALSVCVAFLMRLIDIKSLVEMIQNRPSKHE